jgi:hypothetical protein
VECECRRNNLGFKGQKIGEVAGADSDFDEAWFSECQQCQSSWITILFEAPHYSDSTHWYTALLPESFDYVSFQGSKENVNSVFSTSQVCFSKGIGRGSLAKNFTGVPKRIV